MSSQSVLNPALFRRLSRKFGEVRVTHRGEPFKARVVNDLETEQPRLVVSQYGETYKVCCSRCRDRGFQLAFNHRYGTQDDRLGRPLDFLVTCFARGCFRDADLREELFEALNGSDDDLVDARVRAGTAEPIQFDQLPDSFVRLDKLSAAHRVCKELAALGHDPDRLGRVFGVGYCPADEVRLADERVIVPVRKKGELVGWLAAVCAKDQVQFQAAPGMRCDQHDYNLDRATQYPTGLIVPSPEWVWRIGTAAAAPISLADPERIAQRLRHSFAGKPLILVSPPSHDEAMESLAIELMTRHSAKLAHIQLSDTATKANRKNLKQVIRDAATSKGIAMPFAKQA